MYTNVTYKHNDYYIINCIILLYNITVGDQNIIDHLQYWQELIFRRTLLEISTGPQYKL